MAYKSMVWYDGQNGGTPINAENLNNMIAGIDEAHSFMDDFPTVLDIINSALDKRMGYTDLGTSTNISVFNTDIFKGIIYHVKYNNVDYEFFDVVNDSNNRVQFRFSKNGIEWRKKLTLENWSDFISIIEDGSISEEKLSADLQNDLNNSIKYEEVVLEDLSDINSANYTSPTKKIGLSIVGDAAVVLGVEAGTLGALTTIEADGNYERCITFPSIAGVKWHQTVNSIAPSWSASAWERKAEAVTPSLSIGFDSNYKAVKAVQSSSLTVGNFTNEVKYVYVSSKVTTISSQFLSSATAVTDIYVDNIESGITIAENVKSKVNIHYRGSFNIMDFVALSLVRLGN